MPISILTIVKSRHPALVNLIKGLELGTVMPEELIVVHMNEPKVALSSELFPILSFELSSDTALPLAEARNFAVSKASNPFLIFIDVDCVPAEDLVFSYQKVFGLSEQLWAGHVRYLKKGATSSPDFFQNLHALSSNDPIRSGLKNMTYELFWSLNFGCSNDTFQKIGGFDTLFRGYGGEDTDFSFSAREKNIAINFVDATVFHQYHPSYDPPLNHFEDIFQNAGVFFGKWRQWPMGGWLKKFEQLGLIKWGSDEIQILRMPGSDEIELALKQ